MTLGFEKDDGVFALMRRNLSAADVPVNVYHGDYVEHLPKLIHHAHDGAPWFLLFRLRGVVASITTQAWIFAGPSLLSTP
jgi:hypothetical protein